MRRSTDTSATGRDSSIHNRLVKASPLVNQTHFKFVDVSYSGSVDHKAFRCYSRLGSGPVNSATTVLEKRNHAPFAPGKQRWCRVLDAPGHRPVQRQNPTLGFCECVWE